MIPLIIIRPQPGCDASLAAARERGIDADGQALFEVRPLPWDMPEADSFDALLIGSANALRHGGAALSAFADKPAYAVGEITAEACRSAGLEVVATGEGGLQDMMASLDPAHNRLLRLAGSARVELEPPPGVTIDERVVYASQPVPMPDELAETLRSRAVVALHSAEAARHFRAECDTRGLDPAVISLATIGPRVTVAAGSGWHTVRTAPIPSDDALLALAAEMCKETDEANPSATPGQGSTQPSMQDQSPPPAMTALPPPRRTLRGQLLVALLAFVLGAAAVTWFARQGYLDPVMPNNGSATQLARSQTPTSVNSNDGAAAPSSEEEQIRAVSTVEARLAMLEDRFSRLNLQANAASGNAARAESLLIAFAARRMVDRGEPLRYLADQLQLRFANAQPRAVRTVLDFASNPVTVDELSARLEALAPQLTGQSPDESFWSRATRDLSSLFTVRSEPSELVSPVARIERARVMLRAGRIEESIAQVELLPGAEAAATWLADAQRYANTQKALDLIETAAMLEPSRLQDADGNRVKQPSPLANPAKTPDTRLTPSP